MNKLVQDYIDKMEQEFGEEWAEYLPVYYHEQREMIEGWGYKVHGLSDVQVGEMFENLIMEELCGENYSHKVVNLSGIVSTCSVMEWILMHGCPEFEYTHFDFPEDKIKFGFFAGLPKSITVSKIGKSQVFTDVPTEEWHEPIPGIRRIMPDGDLSLWYCEISGRYYYITE